MVAAATPPGPVASALAAPATRPRPMTASAPAGWGLDPFDRPFVERRSAVVEPAAPGPRGGGRLQGIIITPRGAAAMIDGELYRVGERLGPLEIVSIRRSAVVLRHPGDGTTTTLEVK